MRIEDLSGPSLVVGLVLLSIAVIAIVINLTSIPVIVTLVLRVVISTLRSFISWVVYLFDNREVELPDARESAAEPVVSRAPPARRDAAVKLASTRAFAVRKRRQRRLFALLLLGVALLAPAFLIYNVWLDVLADRREISVQHRISDGTGNLPDVLTAGMTLVADGPADSGSQCTVTWNWYESGSTRVQRRVIHNPDRINVRDVLMSEGIRESPHYDHLPVTFRTRGCQPWRAET